MHTVDAGFFGLALGLSSFVTILPLFLALSTDSPLLIGLIAVVHPLGWHLPQLFTARRVGRLRRFLPAVLVLTANERLPFFGLAALALASASLGPRLTLLGAYALVLWIGLGGGLTANPFQSMVGRIVPPRRRGGFYGAKTAAANLALGIGAVLAGRLLGAAPVARDFALPFALAGLATLVSWAFLAATKETPGPAAVAALPQAGPAFRGYLAAILRRDRAFRRYLWIRVAGQGAMMGLAYYTAFALAEHGLTAGEAGLLTAVFAGAQVLGNPLMGRAGDRLGHRYLMALGMLAASGASVLAVAAPSLAWFAGVFALAGLANVAAWTLPLAMTLEFGTVANRPVYIGLANSLVAPVIVLAPLLGGWLVESRGFETLFWLAALLGIWAAILALAPPPAAPSEPI